MLNGEIMGICNSSIPRVANMEFDPTRTKPITDFRIITHECDTLMHHDIVVAVKYRDGRFVLDKNHWFSTYAINKYREQFLDEDTEKTRNKVELNVYALEDLNQNRL